jgi:RNA polymerase I-specific transcription initiation factor RRN6
VRPAIPGLASANFQEDEWLSSAITTSLSQYNPLLADRLAFGSALCLLDNDIRSGNATVPIVALASGENGESIALTQIGTERVMFSDENEQDFVLRIPTITSSNHNAWIGNGETVLQICFAATSGCQSTWMAARLRSSTTVFHPLFHRRPVPAITQTTDSSKSDMPSSYLDPNPILHIPVSRTGGHPHADISFHPFDCHRLVLIDQHGNWSIWRIGGKRSITSRALYSVQLLRTGKFYTWENLRRPPHANPYHDGWHKICWAADGSGYFDRVLLANRLSSVICDPIEEEKYSLSLGLGQAKEGQWILDIKTSALHPGRVFILTSTRVLCVSTMKEEHGDIPLADSAQVLCSWDHFRGRRDFTLSLTMLEIAQCTIQMVPLNDDGVG